MTNLDTTNIFISPKIEVRKSPIQGMGVFAKEDIFKDEIFEVSYFTLLNQNFNEIDKKLQEYVFSWPKIAKGGSPVIVWGFGSIYNHNKDNNATWDTDVENNFFKFYAIRDIKKDEEICTYYGYTYEKFIGTVK
jgi:SET domain-containing protein